MYKVVKWLLLILVIGMLLPAVVPKRTAEGDWPLSRVKALPVQEGGRVKPWDTLARGSLLVLSGKTQVRLPEGKGKLEPTVWLMEMAMRPEYANTLPVFRVDNLEVKALIELSENEKYVAFDQLAPHFEAIATQAKTVPEEDAARSVFERHLSKLYNGLTLYNQLILMLGTGSPPEKLDIEYATWQLNLSDGVDLVKAQSEGEGYAADKMAAFMAFADAYLSLAKAVGPAVINPETQQEQKNGDWSNIGQSLLNAMLLGEVNPLLSEYAQLMVAYRNGNVAAFTQVLDRVESSVMPHMDKLRVRGEVFFNQLQPFYLSMQWYVVVFLVVAIGWLRPRWKLHEAAWVPLLAAFFVHTLGLLIRMYLQGRPPVTNLYASAIFVGWGGVLFGIILERYFKNGLGAAAASMLGFATLIIAQHLGANSTDTLEMVRAVLDANFWLATHVVVVTLGYSAVFLAGALGVVFILGRYLKLLTWDQSKALITMVYGVIAFATLFSFVGTMLGGIWADQSWGRFWGWDPKENGALLIVLWCAVMLHARWGKLVTAERFMGLAVLGNIVASWSWFGTNMLGVGLHSYGFMDKAFYYLAAFMISQFIIFLFSFGLSPLRKSST